MCLEDGVFVSASTASSTDGEGRFVGIMLTWCCILFDDDTVAIVVVIDLIAGDEGAGASVVVMFSLMLVASASGGELIPAIKVLNSLSFFRGSS